MDIKDGQIIKNLIASEPVEVIKVRKIGSNYSLHYRGINSSSTNNIVIDEQKVEKLELLTNENEFNFKGNPEKFLLFAEAERINSAYQFDPLFAVNCSVIDPLPHQVEAVYKYLLPLPKIRFLLADDTGAGKTIMAGLLIKELLMRGLLERILIVTPGGLTKQWQEDELALKFNLPFKLVDRGAFNSDPNIFSSSDRLVTSIDFIRNEDVLEVIKKTSWDLIIFDEAHKLSAYKYGRRKYVSKRYEAAEALSRLCEHLLLLTATPHRGRKDTFKYLLQLLDSDIFATDQLVTTRISEISKKGANKFFIRRLKEEMRGWQGEPLFKDRHTKTVKYRLTKEEKRLYDSVTGYLEKRRQEAFYQNNQYVSLALMVMQRRLTSSIYAIMNTLGNRYSALKGVLDEIAKNPRLFKQKAKFDLEAETLDAYDELDDEERESMEKIISDPRKFKLFTTAQSEKEIRMEANEVKDLHKLAKDLYNSNQEEQKYTKLKELIRREGVLETDEKLVIFTEHKDTLNYLTDRLSNNGYHITNIHGSMSVDERRAAQNEFAREAKILVATDAAGEGINLQFCRLLINWDIPWNPNRLEQRMGRIHRYGQKDDVMVFNMVADNTREGQVLERLLDKLEIIREQMGDDRVYDVISDVFEDVSMEDILNSTFDGQETSYDDAIETKLTEDNVKQKIKEQKEQIGYSQIDYKRAKELKEHSDERRLQPIYIRKFFEKAFRDLGGEFSEERPSIYKIDNLPEIVAERLKETHNITARSQIEQIHLCFDKEVFLKNQQFGDLGTVHYINPGNPLFDSVVQIIREQYREEMMKGTVLVSPEDKDEHFAFFVKSQIKDNRPHKDQDSIADEKIVMVQSDLDQNTFTATSPAKFIDLEPPVTFAKQVQPPDILQKESVENWTFDKITQPQLNDTKSRVQEDAKLRKKYLDEAFSNVILDLSEEVNELQEKVLLGDDNVQQRLTELENYIDELKQKKKERLKKLERMQELNMKMPEVLGGAFVVPLSEMEFKSTFGMRRDDEVETIAMQEAMQFEKNTGWKPEDVGDQNLGYDIKSSDNDQIKRYIEVKGRSSDGGVMLSANEMNRLAQLREKAWLYIVTHCKSDPTLYRIQDPANSISFEKKVKGVQYFAPQDSWTKLATKV